MNKNIGIDFSKITCPDCKKVKLDVNIRCKRCGSSYDYIISSINNKKYLFLLLREEKHLKELNLPTWKENCKKSEELEARGVPLYLKRYVIKDY